MGAPGGLDRIVRRFQAADRETRLEALLDYAKRLPALPDDLAAAADRDAHRVAECQTPVFLWVGERPAGEGGGVRVWADVPRESPTVRGFVSLLVHALDGAAPGALAALPPDLVHDLRLDETLGMMRMQGLTAVVHRLRTTVPAG